MQVLNKRFVELTKDKEWTTSLDNIYIADPKTGGYRSLSSLYIKIKDDVPSNQVRKIGSVSDFRNEMMNNNVFYNQYATNLVQGDETMHEPILYVDEIEVPNTYDSISHNQTEFKAAVRKKTTKKSTGEETFEEIGREAVVKADKMPYGLKRALAVRSLPMIEKAKTSAVESSPKINKNVKYIYAQVENGKWDFHELDSLTYYDGKEQKTLREAITNNENLSNLIIFDANGDPISHIYTEQGFYFDHVIAQESLDVKEMKKTTYSIEYDGSVVYTIDDVPNKYSMQRYVTKQEPVGDSGKFKTVSYVRTKNYLANENGDYLAIQVNGQMTMLHKDDVLDKNGYPINFINENGEMIDGAIILGEPIYFRDGDKLVASDPVTYEQMMIRYETYKTYQEASEKVPTEETYLRIEGSATDKDSDLKGRYIKELESVQPISYTIVDDDAEFDKYLVKTFDGSKWVSVEKEYFEKNKAKKMFDVQTYRKVQRCDYNSSKCHIVQKTSNDALVEDCVISSKDFAKEVGEEVADKKHLFNEFIKDYKDGKYQVNDLYLNGELVNLAPDKTRYIYTDESDFPDYANETARFKAYNTNDFTKKGEKLKGGPKFAMGKALKSRYKKLTTVVAISSWYLLVAGFFLPATIPAFGAFLTIAAASAVALPFITGLEAIIRNTANSVPLTKRLADKKLIEKAFAKMASKIDKTKYNRKQEEKAIKRELSRLHKNKSKLTQIQFDDAMARIKHRIDNFAATGTTSTLKIEGGKLKVDANNLGLAVAYKKTINRVNKNIKNVEKDMKKCLKKDGKTVKPLLKARYKHLAKKLDELKDQEKKITNQTLTHSHKADKRGGRLESISNDLRLHRIIQTDSDYISSKYSLRPEVLDVLQNCNWSAENGLQLSLRDKILHAKEAKEIQTLLSEIKTERVPEFRVPKPLSEQVEAKQEKLDAGREILYERTDELDTSRELLHETAEGYKSSSEVIDAIASAEQEIATDYDSLDGRLPLDQIDEQIQEVEGHKKHEDAQSETNLYLDTIEQIKQEHSKFHKNLERMKANGQNINEADIAEIDEYIERTLNSDMPNMENIQELQATLFGVQAMNKEVEGNLPEIEDENTQEQQEKQVIETQEEGVDSQEATESLGLDPEMQTAKTEGEYQLDENNIDSQETDFQEYWDDGTKGYDGLSYDQGEFEKILKGNGHQDKTIEENKGKNVEPEVKEDSVTPKTVNEAVDNTQDPINVEAQDTDDKPSNSKGKKVKVKRKKVSSKDQQVGKEKNNTEEELTV